LPVLKQFMESSDESLHIVLAVKVGSEEDAFLKHLRRLLHVFGLRQLRGHAVEHRLGERMAEARRQIEGSDQDTRVGFRRSVDLLLAVEKLLEELDDLAAI